MGTYFSYLVTPSTYVSFTSCIHDFACTSNALVYRLPGNNGMKVVCSRGSTLSYGTKFIFSLKGAHFIAYERYVPCFTKEQDVWSCAPNELLRGGVNV